MSTIFIPCFVNFNKDTRTEISFPQIEIFGIVESTNLPAMIRIESDGDFSYKYTITLHNVFPIPENVDYVVLGYKDIDCLDIIVREGNEATIYKYSYSFFRTVVTFDRLLDRSEKKAHALSAHIMFDRFYETVNQHMSVIRIEDISEYLSMKQNFEEINMHALYLLKKMKPDLAENIPPYYKLLFI